MHPRTPAALCLALAIAATVSTPAAAQDLGSLKNAIGGGGSGTSGSAGNMAGIIQYCIKNNYLGGGTAASIKDKLMGKLGGEEAASQDEGYQAGIGGVLLGKDGQRSQLGGQGNSLTGLANNKSVKNMKDKAVRKGCEMVLDQGKSLL